jgi:hypothetical protein
MLALAMVCLAPLAQAQGRAPSEGAEPPSSATPAQLEEARAHFTRGVKFYKDADYRSALVEFQEAYRVAPNARVLFNIGQTYEELQDFAGAVQAFRDYLKEGGSTISKARRAEVDKDLRRLESHVAVVEISVDQPGADVVVEGDRHQELGKSPLSSSVLLNGGKWTIVATKPGFDRAEERLTAAGGDTKKISLTLVPLAPVQAAPSTPAEPVVTPAPSRSARNLTPFWIGVAVTGALAVGTGVTGGLTLGAKKDFDRELARLPGDADAISSARSHEKTLALVTDVLGGAAIVSAAVTVVLFVSAKESAPPPSSASIKPYLGPTGLGAFGTF